MNTVYQVWGRLQEGFVKGVWSQLKKAGRRRKQAAKREDDIPDHLKDFISSISIKPLEDDTVGTVKKKTSKAKTEEDKPKQVTILTRSDLSRASWIAVCIHWAGGGQLVEHFQVGLSRGLHQQASDDRAGQEDISKVIHP